MEFRHARTDFLNVHVDRSLIQQQNMALAGRAEQPINTPGWEVSCAPSKRLRRLRALGRRCRKHMTTIVVIRMMPTRIPATRGPADGSRLMTSEFFEIEVLLEVAGMPKTDD